jgi:hypothetical protein
VNDVQVADAMPADLLIYSDGGFESVSDFNLGNLVPQFVSIGSEQPKNLAVTAFSAERNVEQPAEIQAFATVMNLGTQAAECAATLTSAGEFLDAQSIALEPGEQTGLSFTISSEEAVTLELKLDVQDDLTVDNVAYAGLTPLRTVSVLVVTEGNSPLRLGLSTPQASKICSAEFVSPGYLQSEEYRLRAEAGLDDLVIFDRCSPPDMPLTNTFFIGSLPPAPQLAETAADESETSDSDSWSWASEAAPVVLVDIDRSHPIMRFLELFSLLVFQGRAVQGPPGSTELIGADVGPVLVLAPRDGYQDMVLGFEIVSSDGGGSNQANTNWYAERSWPVFVLNVLRYLAGAAEATGANSYQPGETVRLRLESALDKVSVNRVGQSEIPTAVGPGGLVEIVDTGDPGNYRIESGEQLVGLFAINLFDLTESEIQPASKIELGYEDVDAAEGGVEERREFWRWALLGMLGLLAAEWWVFARRVA